MSKLPNNSAVPAVVCQNVGKEFYLYKHRTASLREWFIRTVRRQPIHIRQPLYTLTNFNLKIESGESVALLGANGSGKSTVLRLIAGIYEPSAGTVRTSGRIASVIELGAGFHMELTGAENVNLYGSIMGLSRTQLALHYPEIVEFAGIGEFIQMPVKYYSSGMQARLAFSIAICARPDILLLDEVLAVGDKTFQESCFNRLRTFHAEGGTMVVTSHNLDLVRELCSRAIWLDRGCMKMEGPVDNVLTAYANSSI